MKENSKVTDINIGDMKNSIEEDIKIVENYLANSAINEIDSNFFKNGGWETVDLEIPKSMQHILSDYKRVLKENEELNLKYYMLYTGKIENLKAQEFKIKSQVIPVQTVKDKIEELKKNLYTVEHYETVGAINVLQELLEGRK